MVSPGLTLVKGKLVSDFSRPDVFIRLVLPVTELLFSGNCWFLASLGALTFNKEIFYMVVPQDQACMGKDYCGLFHFRVGVVRNE